MLTWVGEVLWGERWGARPQVRRMREVGGRIWMPAPTYEGEERELVWERGESGGGGDKMVGYEMEMEMEMEIEIQLKPYFANFMRGLEDRD